MQAYGLFGRALEDVVADAGRADGGCSARQSPGGVGVGRTRTA